MSLHFLLSVLLGVPEHLGDPVRAVHSLLLLVRHAGARDVQVVVGVDHGHRFALVEAKLAELFIVILLDRKFRIIFRFCFTDISARRSPGSGLVEFLVPTCIVSWIFIRI